MLKSLLLLTIATLLNGCLIQGECGDSASCPAPPPPMTAEVTDDPGAVPVEGALNFYEPLDAVEPAELGASGGRLGIGVHLSRAVAMDLLSGRLVELTPSVGGWSQNAVYRIGTRDVLREIRSLQLTVEADASVTLVAQLGAAEWDSVPLADLPSTATMTIRGPLRLDCFFVVSGAATQSDPDFSSPYCATLRAEFGLDALVARSLHLFERRRAERVKRERQSHIDYAIVLSPALRQRSSVDGAGTNQGIGWATRSGDVIASRLYTGRMP